MKVVICGPRDSFPCSGVIREAIDKSGFRITEIVTGGADGVDTEADAYADLNGYTRTIMPANWRRQGRKAGPIRNRRMVNYADAVIAIWDSVSTGTRTTIEIAQELGKPCYIHPYVHGKSNE